MKKMVVFILVAFFFTACSNQEDKNRFTVTGNIKNAPDQEIYLEELFFSQKNPQVIDTAAVKGGKFVLTGIAQVQGLYRIRLKEGNTGFIFINDKPAINFTADLKDMGIQNTSFNTPANTLLKNYIYTLDSIGAKYMAASERYKMLNAAKGGSDSLKNIADGEMQAAAASHKAYIIKFIDTTSNPVMALFALGNAANFDPAEIEKPVMGLSKRFAGNETIGTIVAQFSKVMAQQQQVFTNVTPGAAIPDITLPDTDDKPYSLSLLRGKYVLVDFWASWCGPCRNENPNVVKAYSKFKDKNFTILGISLDKEKAAWLQAIKDDGLAWQHISDLKYWKSAAVGVYGFNSIPCNILIDPEGKVIATNLKGVALLAKLEELIK